MGAVAALATFSRQELLVGLRRPSHARCLTGAGAQTNVLANQGFRKFLDRAPDLVPLIESYHTCRFAAFFQAFTKLEVWAGWGGARCTRVRLTAEQAELALNLHLSALVANIRRTILERALVLYFQ
jgi:hypothetical protein